MEWKNQMRHVTDFQNSTAYLRMQSAVIADAAIRRGFVELDPFGTDYELIEDLDTLGAFRRHLVDFIESGCSQRTYPLDINEQIGLPSQIYLNGDGKCYFTIIVNAQGSLCYRCTWTFGNKSTLEDLRLIDVALQFGLSGGDHFTSEVFAGSPEVSF